ncbi:MAG: chemotaxis protein CheW [Hydrogenophilus sp.]|nr:chemotaxis protein CheW [Hydrogenophilus sp.]
MSAQPPSPPLRDDGGGDSARRFVLIALDSFKAALAMDEVVEIIRPPRLVRLPKAPSTLSGIANLRGQILPIFSLRHLLDWPERPDDDATRVVVVRTAVALLGLTVDRVLAAIDASDAVVSTGPHLAEALIESWLLLPEYGLTAQLAVAALTQSALTGLDTALLPTPTSSTASTHTLAESARDEEAALRHETQFITFLAAGQTFALPIETVQEIVPLPSLTPIPDAHPAILGMATLREQTLPILSLARALSLPESPIDDKTRTIVIRQNHHRWGLLCDAVREVRTVTNDSIEPLSANLLGGDTRDLAALLHLEGAFALILAVDALAHRFSLHTHTQGPSSEEQSAMNLDAEHTALSEVETDDERQVVVFKLVGEEYAVPIAAVQEIVRLPDLLTRIPQSPPSVEGIINLRGSVLPVLDLRTRFGLPPAERNERQRIIVLAHGTDRIGYIVDAVSEVLKIPATAVEPAPTLSAEQARVIREIANLAQEKRMILLIDPAALLADQEKTQRP